MDVTPHGAFNTLMYEARGSYCFGENTVLLHILRGLGFRLVPLPLVQGTDYKTIPWYPEPTQAKPA
jgi:hypothetical protein